MQVLRCFRDWCASQESPLVACQWPRSSSPRHPSRGHTWNHRSNKKRGAAVHPGSRHAPRHPQNGHITPAHAPKSQEKARPTFCQPGEYWGRPKEPGRRAKIIRSPRRGCDVDHMAVASDYWPRAWCYPRSRHVGVAVSVVTPSTQHPPTLRVALRCRRPRKGTR